MNSPAMPADEPVILRIPGLEPRLHMTVHGPQDKHVSRNIREQGIWEPYETSLVLARLKPGDVFVDVGANIGYFSLVAASVVGEGGQVFAFEPEPANFELLKANVEQNALQCRVHAVQAGLSCVDSDGQLFLSEDNLGDHQIFSDGNDRKALDIRLLQGSNYLQRQLLQANVSHIELIKVDTQGSEYQVILGLKSLLLELPQVPDILIELTPFSLRQAGHSGRQLIELLDTLGQPMWIVDHIEHRLVASTAQELAQWCDNVDTCVGDLGFMNIYLGPDPWLPRGEIP